MIIALERFSQFVGKDGKLTERASNFIEELTYYTNLNTPIKGTGTPEGFVTADIGQRYMDTSGASESVLYIKQTGTGDTGWILG